MRYYKPKDNHSIICLLCKHYCTIKEGKVGICGVNQNSGGELETLVYGYPSAMNIDPIEKKPLYHFLPNTKSFSIGTVGCNLRCPFCQNWEISQTNIVDKTDYFSPKDIVDLALKYNSKSISYTYNEPTIWYPYAKDIGLLAKEAGLKNIFVSSGFESSEVLEDMLGFVDASNIDLKSFNKEYYKKVLKADLDGVLATIKTLAKSGVHLELTTLVIPDVNDSTDELKKMAEFIAQVDAKLPWHLSAFYPNYKLNDTKATPLKTLLKAKGIAKDAGLEYVYIGNITHDTNTYCPKCENLLISRENYTSKIVGLSLDRCQKCNYTIKGVFL